MSAASKRDKKVEKRKRENVREKRGRKDRR
jgi:hypothetical protein